MEITHKLKRPPASTPPLYVTENTSADEKLVAAHYFLPGTAADWYVVEFSSEEQLLFGWAEMVSGGGEWGYTSLRELEECVVNVKCLIDGGIFSIPMRVEFDEYWDNTQTIGEVLAKRP